MQKSFKPQIRRRGHSINCTQNRDVIAGTVARANKNSWFVRVLVTVKNPPFTRIPGKSAVTFPLSQINPASAHIRPPARAIKVGDLIFVFPTDSGTIACDLVIFPEPVGHGYSLWRRFSFTCRLITGERGDYSVSIAPIAYCLMDCQCQNIHAAQQSEQRHHKGTNWAVASNMHKLCCAGSNVPPRIFQCGNPCVKPSVRISRIRRSVDYFSCCHVSCFTLSVGFQLALLCAGASASNRTAAQSERRRVELSKERPMTRRWINIVLST